MAAGRLVAIAAIAMRVGKVIGRHKMAKQFRCDISDGHFNFRRDLAAIEAEAAHDGIYIVRTTVPAEQLDARTVVRTYKSLAAVERDFRSIRASIWTCGRCTTVPKPASAPRC